MVGAVEQRHLAAGVGVREQGAGADEGAGADHEAKVCDGMAGVGEVGAELVHAADDVDVAGTGLADLLGKAVRCPAVHHLVAQPLQREGLWRQGAGGYEQLDPLPIAVGAGCPVQTVIAEEALRCGNGGNGHRSLRAARTSETQFDRRGEAVHIEPHAQRGGADGLDFHVGHEAARASADPAGSQRDHGLAARRQFACDPDLDPLGGAVGIALVQGLECVRGRRGLGDARSLDCGPGRQAPGGRRHDPGLGWLAVNVPNEGRPCVPGSHGRYTKADDQGDGRKSAGEAHATGLLPGG